jgi:hypothetical protein
MSVSGMLTQTIKVQTYSGRDSFGQPQFAPGTSDLPARVESNMEVIKDSTGEERVSDTQAVTLIPVGNLDRVWLPGSDDTDDAAALVPLTVKSAQTPSGGTVLYHLYF